MSQTATSTEPPERPSFRARKVVFDTDDLDTAADFYARLLGAERLRTDDDWVSLKAVDGLEVAFQLAPDHRRPTWPDPEIPQQVHLDLHVADLDPAEAFVLSIGAEPVEGPGEDPTFRVYRDPVGHLFCLCVE